MQFLFNICSLSNDMERLKILEEEQEMLNSSLIALTTHFAQVGTIVYYYYYLGLRLYSLGYNVLLGTISSTTNCRCAD